MYILYLVLNCLPTDPLTKFKNLGYKQIRFYNRDSKINQYFYFKRFHHNSEFHIKFCYNNIIILGLKFYKICS